MTFGAAQGDRDSEAIGGGDAPFSADRAGADIPRLNPAASIAFPRQTCGDCFGHGTVLGGGRVQRLIECSRCAGTGTLAAPTLANQPPPAGDTIMGRPKKKQEDDFDSGDGDGITGEYQRPDAAKAFKIYDEYIAPKKAQISTLTGDCSQPWQDIKKTAHFPRSVMNFLLALENIDDDAKRDHHLLALSEGLKHRKLFVPDDLVTRSDGTAGDEVVPTAARPKPFLAAVGTSNLHEAIGFTEADEAELAAQKDRPSVAKAKAEAETAAEDATEPQPGTGAAAIAAMKKQAEEAGKKG